MPRAFTLRYPAPTAVSWTPASLTSLVAWYDASEPTSITSSGGLVSQWNDLSGNGFHLTQGTGSAQPTTGTRTINSLNALDFDGSSDYMGNSSFAFNYSDWTVFAVFVRDTAVAQKCITGVSVSSAGTDYNNATTCRLMYERADGTIGQYYNGSDGATKAAAAATNYQAVTMRTGTTLKAYVNGSIGTNATGVATTSLSTSSWLSVGAATNGGPGEYHDGMLAALIFQGAAATAGELTSWNTYCARWGL